MEKVDWCDRTTALSWFLLAELSSLTCPLLLTPIALQNTNSMKYKYKYFKIRISIQIFVSFWQSCHRKQVLASPPLLFAPIAGHNTPESLLLSFCKSCPFKNPLPHEVRDTVSHDKHKKRAFASHKVQKLSGRAKTFRMRKNFLGSNATLLPRFLRLCCQIPQQLSHPCE